MSGLHWYWHRFRAMSPLEVAGHVRRQIHRITDQSRARDWAELALPDGEVFPRLPDPAMAPAELRVGLERETREILAGRWRAFGHLEMHVDDPPHWHTDYAAGVDSSTTVSAFRLNHRALPGGADIKLIWELSRWHALVRLAEAAWLLGDRVAGQKCLRWLEDWVRHNEPFRGWNWTSALESGLRLVQFVWMDALLARGAEPSGYQAEWERLRYQILPPHVWHTWRHRSFGSSANNHLIGELAGLILATVRWPAVGAWAPPLERLQRMWESEVLAQFAEDGGNREQGLHYHLFSFEFCWQVRTALLAARREISTRVLDRLTRAAAFFAEMQVGSDPWDYGDSDDAFVSPLFSREETAAAEWLDWLARSGRSAAIGFWLGAPPEPTGPGAELGTKAQKPAPDSAWTVYPESGLAILRARGWILRWDFSPLGYLRTAAHGHLDALHVSLWREGVALVVDPGTGVYYADPKLRNHLASRSAHNGPCPAGVDFPRRLGPFLWSEHHACPVWRHDPDSGPTVELELPTGRVQRTVRPTADRCGWEVEDQYALHESAGRGDFSVCWQFAPATQVSRVTEHRFRLQRRGVSLEMAVGEDWTEVDLVERPSPDPPPGGLAGLVSPAFRRTCFAPFLKLRAAGGKRPCVFRTVFLA